MTGRVVLVGAGPGDPDLITVKGARALAEADVVVYDRLAAPALLQLAPTSAERIYVGKQPGGHAMKQEQIDAVLVEQALLGRTVVRLKGGDPFVFGRGGEELLACAEAGVPCEVDPRHHERDRGAGRRPASRSRTADRPLVRGGDGIDGGHGPRARRHRPLTHRHRGRHAGAADGRRTTRRHLPSADRRRDATPTNRRRS